MYNNFLEYARKMREKTNFGEKKQILERKNKFWRGKMQILEGKNANFEGIFVGGAYRIIELGEIAPRVRPMGETLTLLHEKANKEKA